MLTLLLLAAALAGDDGFDHGHAKLDAFLDGAVSPTGVDYATLKGRTDTLGAYLQTVETADLSTFDEPQALALWVNAYNAYTLKTMLEEGPPASIRDLDGGNVWDARTFTVAGQQVTLNQMEHEHARKLADGRVHAVVNCASRGCPPLPPDPVIASDLEARLDAAARRWASTNAFDLSGDTIALNKIFDWYGEDFAGEHERDLPNVEGKAEDALWFLAEHVDEATRKRLLSGELTATWKEYDWSLNRQ